MKETAKSSSDGEVIFMVTSVKTFADGLPPAIGLTSGGDKKTRTRGGSSWIESSKDPKKYADVCERVPISEAVREYRTSTNARDVQSIYGRTRMKGLKPQFRWMFDSDRNKMIQVRTGARVDYRTQNDIDARTALVSSDEGLTNSERLCESIIIGRTLEGQSIGIRVRDSLSATYRVSSDSTAQLSALCSGKKGQMEYIAQLCTHLERLIESSLIRRTDMKSYFPVGVENQFGTHDSRRDTYSTIMKTIKWSKEFKKPDSVRQAPALDTYPQICTYMEIKGKYQLESVAVCSIRLFWALSASDYQWMPVYHTCKKRIIPAMKIVYRTLTEHHKERNPYADVSRSKTRIDSVVSIIQSYFSPVQRRPEVFFQVETRISSVTRAVRSIFWDYETEKPKNAIRYQNMRVTNHLNRSFASKRAWIQLPFVAFPCAREVTGARKLIQRHVEGAGDIVRFVTKGSSIISQSDVLNRRTSFDVEYDSRLPGTGWSSIYPANRPNDPPASDFGAVAVTYDLEVITPAPAFPKSQQMCNMITSAGLHRGFQVGQSGVHETGSRGELPTTSVMLSLKSMHSKKASNDAVLHKRGIEWRAYANEMDLLNGMREQILQWAPDIFSGYNSHIFDDRYAVERASLLNALARSPRMYPIPPSQTPWFVFVTLSNPGILMEKFDTKAEEWIPLPSSRMTDILVGAGGPAQGLAFHPLPERMDHPLQRSVGQRAGSASTAFVGKKSPAYAYRVIRSSARSFFISDVDDVERENTEQTVHSVALSNIVKGCEFQCIVRPMDPLATSGWGDSNSGHDFRMRITFDVKNGGFPTLQVARLLAGLFRFRSVQEASTASERENKNPPFTDLAESSSELERHISTTGSMYVRSVFEQVVVDFGQPRPSPLRCLFMYLTPILRYGATYRVREVRSDKRSSTSIYFIDPRDTFTNVDVMAHIKKTYRLPSYSLKSVCKQFLKEMEKYEMDIPTLFDIAYGTRLFHEQCTEDLKQSVSEDLRQRKADGAEVILLQSRDDGYAAVSLYCAIDAARVLELMHALQIGDNTKIMSKVAGFGSFNDTTRGQMQKLGFMLYKFSTTQFGAIMDPPRFKCIDAVNKGLTYTGATVCDPIKGAHDWVVCLDFASLYPSIMMGERMSPDLLLNKKLRDIMSRELVTTSQRLGEDSKDPQSASLFLKNLAHSCKKHASHSYKRGGLTRLFKWIDESEKVPRESTHAAFVQTDPGIIPSLERDLLQLRTKFKKNMKHARKIKDTVMASYWNRMQLVVKILMNSLYGFLGNGSSPQNKMGVAGSVCAHARHLLALAVKEADKRGWGLFYGDTDSIFVQRRVPVPHLPQTSEEVSLESQLLQVLTSMGFSESSLGLSIEGIERARRVRSLGELKESKRTEIAGQIHRLRRMRRQRSLVPNFKVSMDLEKDLNRFYACHEATTNKLECEKIFYPVFLLAKKKYCGFSNETDDPNKGKFYSSGLSSNKRDLPPFLRSLTTEVFKCICVRGDRNGAVAVLYDHLRRLLEGKVPIEDIAVCKKLKSRAFQRGPKPIHEIVNDRLAELDPGRRKKPGEYIRYGFRARPPHASVRAWKKKSLAAVSIEDIRVVDISTTVLNRLYKFGVSKNDSRGDLREVAHMFSENNPFPFPKFIPHPGNEKGVSIIRRMGIPIVHPNILDISSTPNVSDSSRGVFWNNKLYLEVCLEKEWPAGLAIIDGTESFAVWRAYVQYFVIRFRDIHDSGDIRVVASITGYYESHSAHSLEWNFDANQVLPSYLSHHSPQELIKREIASVPFGKAVDSLLLRAEYATSRINIDQVPYRQLLSNNVKTYSRMLDDHTQAHIQARVDRYLKQAASSRKRKTRS